MAHTYSDALRRVAPHLAQHMQGKELLRISAHYDRVAGDDGWTVAEATYWLGAHWHSGQWCPLYAALCATDYSPGACSKQRPEKWSPAADLLAAMIRIVRIRKARLKFSPVSADTVV